MIFTNDKPIYLQMADRLCDEILSGVYKDDDRIPSVREYSVLLEVNTNTVLRAFDILQRDDILLQQRGIGMLVAKGAKRKIRAARKKEFLTKELPDFLRRLDLLDLDIEDVVAAWKEYKK